MLKSLQRNKGSVQTEQGQSGIQPGLVGNRASIFTQSNSSNVLQNQAPSNAATSVVQGTLFKSKRVLPATPVKRNANTIDIASTSTSSQHALPTQSRINLNKALSWIRINDINVKPENYDEVIQDIQTGELDLLERDEAGLNWLHSAAQLGSAEFFDLIKSMPDVWVRVKDHLNDYSGEHCTILGYAIGKTHFELAIKLIISSAVNVDALVHDVVFKANDNTVSMMRLALSYIFTENFSQFSDDKKESLGNLIRLLMEKRLRFFETQNSHCPPVFQVEKNLFSKFLEKDLLIMKESRLTEEEYALLYNLRLFKKRSPEIFELFVTEAKNIKNSNISAQKILSLLGKHEIFISADTVDRSQCLKI